MKLEQVVTKREDNNTSLKQKKNAIAKLRGTIKSVNGVVVPRQPWSLKRQRSFQFVKGLRCWQPEDIQRHHGNRKGISIGSTPRSKFRQIYVQFMLFPHRIIAFPISNHFAPSLFPQLQQLKTLPSKVGWEGV